MLFTPVFSPFHFFSLAAISQSPHHLHQIRHCKCPSLPCFLPHSKLSWGTHTWKFLTLQTFLLRMPLWKKTPSQSTLKYGSENRLWVRGLRKIVSDLNTLIRARGPVPVGSCNYPFFIREAVSIITLSVRPFIDR